MFKGTYEHSLDAKGRLAIPAKLRDAIPEAQRFMFTICRGHEGCLYLYTLAEWERIEKEKSSAAANAPEDIVRERDRLAFSAAEDVVVDGQGRILLPLRLKAKAGITKDVVLLGVRDRMEIWDKQKWEEYEATKSSEYEKTEKEVWKYRTGGTPSGANGAQ